MYNGGNDKKEFSINADGSFEIDTSLLSENDLVILVVNSTTKKVYGHLNLDAGSNNKLDFIDKTKLQDDLDFGSIDTENNCSSSTNLDSTTAFSNDDLSKMKKIAISDNALILYKNKYVNPDYDAEIQILYNMDAINDIKGSWSDVNNFNTSNLIGLRPTIKTNLSSYNNVSENQIFLYPPSNVNYTTNRDGNFNQTASSSNPLPSTYKGTNDGNFYEFAFVENFPQGDWNLKINGDNNIKGKFNFSSAYPYDTSGKSIVPVPQIKLNLDPNDNTKLKSIDVKWYVYNGTQYEQVSDDVMSGIASQDHDGNDIEVALRSNYGQDIGIFKSNTWNGTYTLQNGGSVAIPTNDWERRINVSYIIGQASYQFLFQ